MVQELLNLQQKILKLLHIHCVLGNISKDWLVDNMKKTGLKGYVYDFSVDYDAIAVSDILDIHKYLMKENEISKNVWICEANICFNDDVFWF